MTIEVSTDVNEMPNIEVNTDSAQNTPQDIETNVFLGPKGDKGDRGPSGIEVSEREPIDSDVKIWLKPDGDSSNILKVKTSGAFIDIPSIKGESATIEIGSVEYGEDISVTNSGTPTHAVLDFVFPLEGGGEDPSNYDGIYYEDITDEDIDVDILEQGYVSDIEFEEALATKQDKGDYPTRLEVNQLIASLPKFKVVVGTRPETGEDMTIYLEPKEGTDNDIYNEYLWVNNAYELLGTTAVDLTDYLTASKLGVANISQPITEAEYEALTPDENTLYLIKEE